MLKKNQELLKALQAADKLAREMYDAGERVGKIITDLKTPIARVEARIRGLQKMQAESPEPKAKAPKAKAG